MAYQWHQSAVPSYNPVDFSIPRKAPSQYDARIVSSKLPKLEHDLRPQLAIPTSETSSRASEHVDRWLSSNSHVSSDPSIYQVSANDHGHNHAVATAYSPERFYGQKMAATDNSQSKWPSMYQNQVSMSFYGM
jgi:hypothetical protein